MFKSGEFMHPFRVVSGIREQRSQSCTPVGLTHHLFEVQMIGTRSAARHSRQDQVRAAIGQQSDLRKTPVGHGLHMLVAARSSSNKVMADVVSLKAAAIHGTQAGASPPESAAPGGDQGFIEQTVSGVFFSSRSAAF